MPRKKLPVYKDKVVDKDVSVETSAPAKLVRKKTNAKKAKSLKTVPVLEKIEVINDPVLSKPPLVNWYYVTMGILGAMITGLLFYYAAVTTNYINSLY